MPNPKSYKDKKSFMKTCVPQVVQEGKEQKQAVAICSSLWANRNKAKSSEDGMDKLDQTLPESLQNVIPYRQGACASVSEDDTSSSGGTVITKQEGLAGTSSVEDTSYSEQEHKTKEQQAMAEKTESIREEVEQVLAEKDAAAQIESKIADLTDKAEKLSEALSEKETANAELSDNLESLKTEKAEVDEKVVTLAEEKEELEAKAAKLESELDDIRREQAMATRKAKLEEAGILFTEGEKRDAQLEKVKAMEDEAFASYVQELVDLLESVKGNKSDGDDTEGDETEGEDDKSEAGKNDTEGDDTEGDDDPEQAKASKKVAPADLSHGEIYRQAVAFAHSDVPIEEDHVEQYAKL
jgi:chromosome segregation ATPase